MGEIGPQLVNTIWDRREIPDVLNQGIIINLIPKKEARS